MDMVEWDKKRFDLIKEIIFDYLMTLGFEKHCVTFVPISAYSGINLSSKLNVEKASWWKGENLMQIIENLPLPKRNDTKPIRFSINNVYHLNNEKGIFISGKVEGGIIEEKEKLVLLPHDIRLGIRKIIRNSNTVNQAFVG